MTNPATIQEKKGTIAHYLHRLADASDTNSTVARSLANAEHGDLRHLAAEALRVATQSVKDAEEVRDHLLSVAVANPEAVPIARAARLANLSPNTVRARTGRRPIQQDATDSPF